MVDDRLKELRGTSRRNFLRWSATVAACLGVERSRLLNVLNDTAGTAAADTAACATTNRHIHVVDGNGGLANWTLPFPVPAVAKGNNQQFSHHMVGQGVDAQGYDKPWVFTPDSPFQKDTTWKMTAFVGGQNETHTATPNSVITLGGNTMMASAAAIQQANPTLLPVLAVGGIQFGAAPGAPQVAAVGAADQLVGLFNSQASRALLAGDTNGPLAESYYKAFLGLNAAAGRTTIAKPYATGKVSMNLLAKNLASQLTPTQDDLTAMGIGQGTPGAVANMGRAMITTLKAFSLGLTSMLLMRGFNNDPHGMFAGGNGNATTTSAAIARMMDGLYTIGKSLQDPACSAKTLADALVFSVSGDTFKQPFDRNNWGDGTPGGSNLLYVMGAGRIKTGWFGELANGNTARSFDVGTGNVSQAAYNTLRGPAGAAASAAVLFAVAKGDMRRVSDFYNGPAIDALVNLNVTG
ncbi:MAG: hypothetical protein KIT84_30920 [Labilithrix sp.]|nr:hypothetical protein [Labilithrix sp.]MCW5815481.1 hypothetical protein [Labilithrix sp.]